MYALRPNANMTTQKRQIDEMLTSEGWNVVDRQFAPTWWLDEVWVLESTSEPANTRAYLSFLVDPQSLSLRKTGTEVWAVCVSSEGPAVTPMGNGAVPLRPNWERQGRKAFLEKIRALRAGA
jgi:hypothetical protein